MNIAFPPSELNKDLIKALIRITELQTYISKHEEIQGVAVSLEVEYVWTQKLSMLYDYLVPYYLTGVVHNSNLENAIYKLRRMLKATEPYAQRRERKDLIRQSKLVPLPEKGYELIPVPPNPTTPVVVGIFKKGLAINKFLISAISSNGQRLSSQVVIDIEGDFTEYSMINKGELLLYYDIEEITIGGEDFLQLVIKGHNLLDVVHINIFTYNKFITDTKIVLYPGEGFGYKLPLTFIL